MPCHLPSHSVSGFAASWRDGDHPEFGAAGLLGRLMDENGDFITDENTDRIKG